VQKQIEETVHGLDTVAGMFEQNSCVAGEVHDVFDTIEKSIRDIATEDRELSQELQGFMAAELDINNSFADVNKNAADCSSYSEQALQISTEQTKSVAALKNFVEQLDTMSTELTAKIESFKL
jgi:methyl-accepting chemotaxis protein